MSSLIYFRTGQINSPIATWDDIEDGIAFVEQKINAVDENFVYTPFVPGQRTATWVMTKTEIQGLEDRLHTIAVYLNIPHVRTVWVGKMPINYNAFNHLILALAPQETVDTGNDTHNDPESGDDGDLHHIIPPGYDVDPIHIVPVPMPPDEQNTLDDLIGQAQQLSGPIDVFGACERYWDVPVTFHVYVQFEYGVTVLESQPGFFNLVSFEDVNHNPVEEHGHVDSVLIVENYQYLRIECTVDNPYFHFCRIRYTGSAEIYKGGTLQKVPAFDETFEAG